MDIRVQIHCLDWDTKKNLRHWKIKIRKDWKVKGVRILTLPPNLKLIESNSQNYNIETIEGRYLGFVLHPFESDGGILSFEP